MQHADPNCLLRDQCGIGQQFHYALLTRRAPAKLRVVRLVGTDRQCRGEPHRVGSGQMHSREDEHGLLSVEEVLAGVAGLVNVNDCGVRHRHECAIVLGHLGAEDERQRGRTLGGCVRFTVLT